MLFKNNIHTNLSLIKISFTEHICFVICAISLSDCANDINNCSRSGLIRIGPFIGVVLRACRRLKEFKIFQKIHQILLQNKKYINFSIIGSS